MYKLSHWFYTFMESLTITNYPLFVSALMYIRIMIIILSRYNWKKITALITLPILIYQLFVIIQTYLQFSTEVSVQLIPFRDPENNHLKYDSFPAITVCTNTILDEIIENQNQENPVLVKTNELLINNSLNYNESVMFRKLPFSVHEINSNVTRSFDFLKAVISQLNLHFNYRFYYRQHVSPHFIYKDYYLKPNYQANMNISRLFQLSILQLYRELATCIYIKHYDADLREPCLEKYQKRFLSKYGRCFTNLYNPLHNTTMFYSSRQFYFELDWDHYVRTQYISKIFRRMFIMHSPSNLPIFNDLQLSLGDIRGDNKWAIKITKLQFDRLPPPYETQCYDYGKSSRFQCVNEWYESMYRQELKCIPFEDSLMTIDLNDKYKYNSLNFCKNRTKIVKNELIEHDCSRLCGTPCQDDYFSYDSEMIFKPLIEPIIFYIDGKYYSRLIYSPKTTFYSLIIDMANIWSLWHGISFAMLTNIAVILLRTHFRMVVKYLQYCLLKLKLIRRISIKVMI